MMDRTDRHFRFLLRRISRRTLLYTEMVTAGAVLHGDRDRLLAFDPDEHPIALQLGGEDPAELAACARIAEDLGYDEVNLNIGCPSDRVQRGRFGACLMAEPERVAEGVVAMRETVDVPVTVKHRIGIDDLDRYEDMLHFVDTVAAAGADRFSVHARKAWLAGLSPKENREVPPLRYDDVYRLKAERPDQIVEINGGVRSLEEAEEHLRHVDAVMIGRAAWDDPYLFADADRRLFGESSEAPSRREVIEGMIPYAEACLARGDSMHLVLRGLLGLFPGVPGARAWRRTIGEGARSTDDPAGLLREAMRAIPDEALDARGADSDDSPTRSGQPKPPPAAGLSRAARPEAL